MRLQQQAHQVGGNGGGIHNKMRQTKQTVMMSTMRQQNNPQHAQSIESRLTLANGR